MTSVNRSIEREFTAEADQPHRSGMEERQRNWAQAQGAECLNETERRAASEAAIGIVQALVLRLAEDQLQDR
jgi:hypothetical protein